MKCPNCYFNSPGTYIGITNVCCANQFCKHFSEKSLREHEEEQAKIHVASLDNKLDYDLDSHDAQEDGYSLLQNLLNGGINLTNLV